MGFVYSPLIISSGIAVVGNVPDVQQYDISTGLYTPDYTGSFLCLKCWLEVTDPDGILTASEKVLTNIRWYRTEGGAETQITGGNDYAIDTDGILMVKKNVNPDTPLTFRCEAEFLDARNGEIHRIVETRQVMAESVSQRPVLGIDTPLAIRYDPIRDDNPIRKVKASFRIGDMDVPAAHRELIWQKKDEGDTAFSDIDGSDIMDYDVSLSADKTELTIDCSLIGKRIDIRVYAKYNPFGNPSSMPIDSTTAKVEFAAVRYEATLKGQILAPRLLYPTQKYIYPECVCSDTKGIIPNPESKCDIAWKVSKGVAAGTVTPGAVIATGVKPTIPTTSVVKTYGGKLIAEIKAKEPLKAATVGGDVLTVNGQVILVR